MSTAPANPKEYLVESSRKSHELTRTEQKGLFPSLWSVAASATRTQQLWLVCSETDAVASVGDWGNVGQR